MKGIVTGWNSDEGWGVVESPDLPGGEAAWTHFSAVQMEGFVSLRVGQAVELTFERAGQDGYRYRAVTVKPT